MARWIGRRGYLKVEPGGFRIGMDILDARLHPWRKEVELQVTPMIGEGTEWLPMRVLEFSSATHAQAR
jgi:hypothetical protein